MKAISGAKAFLVVLLASGLCSCLEDGSPDPILEGPEPRVSLPALPNAEPVFLTADHVGDVQAKDSAGVPLKDGSGKVIYSLPSATFQKMGSGLLASSETTTEAVSGALTSSVTSGLEGMEIVHLCDILFNLGKDIAEWITGSREQTEADKRFEELKDTLNDIEDRLTALNEKMDLQFDLMWSQLNLTQAQQALFEPTSNMDFYFTGSTADHFSYFSRQSSLIEKCMATAGYPGTCTREQQNAYMNTSLKTDSAKFASRVTGEYGIPLAIHSIYFAIVPEGKTQILKALARYIATNSGSATVGTPAEKAMNAYLVLESMFIQLLTYQYQGAVMVANAYNMQDIGKPPLSNGKSVQGMNAAQFLTGDFEHYIRLECAEFLDQVSWLAVNYSDYRNTETYQRDMDYVTQGLAPDVTFGNVLARARFFCAQVLEPFNQNRAAGGNGTWPADTTYPVNTAGFTFGLHGVIIVPYEYTKGVPLTIKFYNNKDVLVKTVTATPSTSGLSRKFTSRFPYTKWETSTAFGNNPYSIALPDWNWLVYDLNLPADGLGAGTYTVKFDSTAGTDPNGNWGPWLHSTNLLGALTMRWYDPVNPTAGTASPDADHVVPFAGFALYWPWGYQRLVGVPVSDESHVLGWTTYDKSSDVSLSFWPSYPGDGTIVDHVYVTANDLPRKSFSFGPSGVMYVGKDTYDADTTYQGAIIYAGDNKVTGTFRMADYGDTKSTSIWFNYGFEGGDGNQSFTVDSGESPAGNLSQLSLSSANATIKTAAFHTGLYHFQLNTGWDSTYKVKGKLVSSTVTADLKFSAQFLFMETKLVKDI